MKKNILFIINNLNCGGAEKALISLLETIDYSIYKVDLLLFKHEGIFYNKIPKEVTVLEEPHEYRYFDMPLKKALASCLKDGNIDIFLSRICAGYIFKTEENKALCEQRAWKYISKSLNNLEKKYDVAIGYLEKGPVYFCIDKVNAPKKIGFIHNDYDKLGMSSDIDINYFKKLDNIVTVSEECASVLRRRFPMQNEKISIMHNIVSSNIINKMSKEKIEMDFKGIKIVSVGRLSFQKGFDLAVGACKQLVDDGYGIKWYVIGEGEDRIKLERMIRENSLHNIFILLGIKENPYPYIRQADLYVQPSRFEGKSIAIDEAKILAKPIVITNFSTAKDQITHEINGLIADITSISLAKTIERLIKDNKLCELLVKNLSNENLSNENEIEKLYKMVND